MKIALTLLFCGLASAQTAFEVASIKPAQPPDPATMMQGKFKVGLHVDAGRADIGFFSLRDLISVAYGVKDYQIAGPDWLNGQRFDIAAKMPEGAKEDQVPEMLRALLAERFHLEVHRETREHSIYALVEAKGGSKLKESAPDKEPADAPIPDKPAAQGGGGKDAGNAFSLGQGDAKMTVRVTGGPGNTAATMASANGANFRMTMGPDGNMQMQASKMTMPMLAEYLRRLVDRPVFDRTELKGKYDLTLEVSLADMMRAATASGVVPIGPGRGAGGPGGAPADAASDPGGSIFAAVQKMGLRLEPRKEQIETIVVDRAEKNPTEN